MTILLKKPCPEVVDVDCLPQQRLDLVVEHPRPLGLGNSTTILGAAHSGIDSSFQQDTVQQGVLGPPGSENSCAQLNFITLPGTAHSESGSPLPESTILEGHSDPPGSEVPYIPIRCQIDRIWGNWGEYMLVPKWRSWAVQQLGVEHLTLGVDLFATPWTTAAPLFITREMDAFSFHWGSLQESDSHLLWAKPL